MLLTILFSLIKSISVKEFEGMAQPVSVSITQMNTNFDFDTYSSENGCTTSKCNDEPNNFKCGKHCWTNHNGIYFEYRFLGEKFGVYGSKNNANGKFTLFLDGKNHTVIDLYKNTQNNDADGQILVYTSDLLQYGYHTIRAQVTGGMTDIYKFVYWPSVRAIRLNASDIETNEEWNSETDDIGGSVQITQRQRTKILNIRCSKIWIYGRVSPDYVDTMNVDIDDEITYKVKVERSPEKNNELLFFSDPLIFRDHVIQIYKNDIISLARIGLSCVYYLPEPYIEPQIPISVSIDQMKQSGMNQNNCEVDGCMNELTPSCGKHCWFSDPNNYLEYTFRGEQFGIFATTDNGHKKMSVMLDGKNCAVIDLKETKRREKVEVYRSEKLLYGDHTVKIQPFDKDNTIDIYKLIYWPTVKSQRINSTYIMPNDKWSIESDGIGGVMQTTQNEDTTKTTAIRCSKIWVYGSTDNSFGSMSITIDDSNYIMNVKSDTRVNGALLFESEILPFGIHNISIKKVENQNACCISCIYYHTEPLSLSQIPVPVPVTQMNFSHGVILDGNDWNCNKNPECTDDIEVQSPSCGVKCWVHANERHHYQYIFRGVRFAIYGNLNTNHGECELYLDGKFHCIINFNHYRQFDKVCCYKSGLLPYGDHTIKIQTIGKVIDVYKYVYWPSSIAIRLNATDIPSNEGWTTLSDQIGGAKQSASNNDAVKSITVKCSKFWVYGSIESDDGKLEIQFDNKTKVIDKKSGLIAVNSSLLYESDILPFKDYTITIRPHETSSGIISLYSIFYHPQEIPIPTPVPISIGIDQMKTNILEARCSSSIACQNHIDESSSTCGKSCWSQIVEDKAYFNYTFIGEKFQIYGKVDPTHGSFYCYIDDQPPLVISETYDKSNEFELVYTSEILEYGSHQISIQQYQGNFQLYKLAYWPYVKGTRINSTDIPTNANWNNFTDNIGGLGQATGDDNAKKQIQFTGLRIWVYGFIKKTYGYINVTIDGKTNSILERDETKTSSVSAMIHYENDLRYGTHDLVVTHGVGTGTIALYCIYIDTKYPIIYDTPGEHKFLLSPGKYFVDCYGAQGGEGRYGNDHRSRGGKGAHTSGIMIVTGPIRTFFAFVGGNGGNSSENPSNGGFNGGGSSGKADYIDYTSGGGGGATDLRIDENNLNNRIMVAAGGSGGASYLNGADGGDLKGKYYELIDNVLIQKDSNSVDQNDGETIVGQSGQLFASFYPCPSSGGGGGYRCGVTQQLTNKNNLEKLVSHSGSSFISGYSGCDTKQEMSFIDSKMESGVQEGDGLFVIDVIYECRKECSDCTDSYNCTDCQEGYYLYNFSCITECPEGMSVEGRKCVFPTQPFSKSLDFTESYRFSASFDFTKSSGFVASDAFSKSSYFSDSDDFSKSSNFVKTSEFTESSVFSKSSDFVKTSGFTKSSGFSETSEFTESFGFSKSSDFVKTSEFTESFEFSKSSYFDKTSGFTKSSEFSKSSDFDKTSGFTKSSVFSKSSDFDQTSEFTESSEFSKSSDFDKTSGFTKSSVFSKSSDFDKTSGFTKSSVFSKSSDFDKTSGFTKSSVFSKSSDFDKTSGFTKSSGFTESSGFVETSKFTKSSGFSKSSDFTLSLTLTNSIASLSDEYETSSNTESETSSESPEPETSESLSSIYSESKSESESLSSIYSESKSESESLSSIYSESKSESESKSKSESKSESESLSSIYSESKSESESESLSLIHSESESESLSPIHSESESESLSPIHSESESESESLSSIHSESESKSKSESESSIYSESINDNSITVSESKQTSDVIPPFKSATEEIIVTISTKEISTSQSDIIDPGNDSGPKKNKANIGMIAGIVAGIVVFIILLIILIIFLIRRNKKKDVASDEKSQIEMPSEQVASVIDFENPLYNNYMQNDPFDQQFGEDFE